MKKARYVVSAVPAQYTRAVFTEAIPHMIDEAILISELLPLWMRSAAFRDLGHQWFFDGQEHVDPAKEANYTIFGEVISGMDVAKKLTLRDPDQGPDFSGSVIETITIEEK